MRIAVLFGGTSEERDVSMFQAASELIGLSLRHNFPTVVITHRR
jgi:D-alanine-D-alanine ligase-like ATP-grasp enzyme